MKRSPNRRESKAALDRTVNLVGGIFVNGVAPAGGAGQDFPPILFLHGAWHGWWVWEAWQDLFASWGWINYALSLRGHQGSESIGQAEFLALTVTDYLEDIASVLAWIGQPTVVIGHSLGGILAQKTAESIRLRGLVLMASGSPAEVGPLRDQDFPDDRPIRLDPADGRDRLFFDAAESVIAATIDRLVAEPPGVLNLTARGRVSVEKGQIRCPILVVGAEHDRMVHPAERLAAHYDCPSFVVAGAGHDLMLERQNMSAAHRIVDWLENECADRGHPS